MSHTSIPSSESLPSNALLMSDGSNTHRPATADEVLCHAKRVLRQVLLAVDDGNRQLARSSESRQPDDRLFKTGPGHSVSAPERQRLSSPVVP